jgi:hypothetical protein
MRSPLLAEMDLNPCIYLAFVSVTGFDLAGALGFCGT